jgi:IS5 family transposase
LVIKTGKQKKIILGRKSRTDTTVVEENVAYPTDSTLLEKGKKLLIKSANKI